MQMYMGVCAEGKKLYLAFRVCRKQILLAMN